MICKARPWQADEPLPVLQLQHLRAAAHDRGGERNICRLSGASAGILRTWYIVPWYIKRLVACRFLALAYSRILSAVLQPPVQDAEYRREGIVTPLGDGLGELLRPRSPDGERAADRQLLRLAIVPLRRLFRRFGARSDRQYSHRFHP